MKKIILTSLFFIAVSFSNAQNNWFKLYNDSASLVQDARIIRNNFLKKVNKKLPAAPSVILNTTPYLIFFFPKDSTVNIPIWSQVINEQKKFFYELAGSEEESKKMFAIFFNGFYLTHELGHYLRRAAKSEGKDAYDEEYKANTVAMLYWLETKQEKQLKQCYAYAKKAMAKLTNPIPAGENTREYFTKHYEELSSDPNKYGYMQFSQFIEIYESKKSLPSFNQYVESILKK
jgi:hypothetical protein